MISIDVIIPTYNRAHLISRSINSVLNQTYKNFHLYIIDDGSTDNTSDVLKSFLNIPNVHFLKQNNKGVSAARNLGIRKSSSCWICFLDSDDEWLPHKLQTQVNFHLLNPSIPFIHSNEIWMRNNIRINPKLKFDKGNHEIFKRSLETCLISPSTVMLKRDLILSLGLFDENLTVCEDYDLWLKVLIKNEIGFISDNLIIKYAGHEGQLSTAFFAMDYWRLTSLCGILKNSDLNLKQIKLIEEVINRKADRLLKNYLKYKNFKEYNNLLNLLGRDTKTSFS
jgi:glycosyltransferase involved in cell wall biosynthesis